MISDEQRKQLNAWFRSSEHGVATEHIDTAALYFAKLVMDALPEGEDLDDTLNCIRVAWKNCVTHIADGKGKKRVRHEV